MRRKKKDESEGRGPQRRKPFTLGESLSPRMIVEALRQFVGGPSSAADDTPSAQAQALLAQAYDTANEKRRMRLARQALEMDPDCADAFVLLAEDTKNRKEALKLYEQGVQAAERALGPEVFQQSVGHFWGIGETRPYMNARLRLAHALWTSGRREETIAHLQEMLRLNPNDNQGVRYTLAGFLLAEDRDSDLAKLLQQYPEEGSAAWAYTKALLLFREKGDTAQARQLLKKAFKTNPHVPAYILGQKFPPQEQPDYYSPGDESEAQEYIGSFLVSWKATAGAMDWLRHNDPKTKKKQAEAPQAKGPLSFIKKWLTENLEQEYDVWQADCRPMSNAVVIAGKKVRPWMVLVTSRDNDGVLAHNLFEVAPSASHIWDVLVQAMQKPMAGEPHRPTELQVRLDERWESLRKHIEEVGINVTVTEELDHIDFLFQDLTNHLGGRAEPGLLDVPGVKPEQVGSFYEAAAAFYQQAPWRKVGYETAIQVECDKFHGGPWYAVPMGQSGLATGLALYEDLKLLKKLWAGQLSDKENARRTVATTLLFGDETDLSLADLDGVRRYGWKVARPDAYPSIFHKERGLTTRPPLSWELELMEGCLRTLPDFLKRRKQDDPTQEEVTTHVASGELKLRLSWLPD